MRGRLVLGGLLVLAGLVWLLRSLGVLDVPVRLLVPVALVAVGVLLLSGPRRSRPGLILLGAALTIVLTVGSVVFPPGARSGEGVGRVERVPRTLAELRSNYRLDAGRLVLNLTELPAPDLPRRVQASVGAGRLTVIVGRDLDARVEASAGVGEVDVFGRQSEGIGVSESSSTASRDATLILDLSVGVGRVEVRTGPSRLPAPPRPPRPHFPFEPFEDRRGTR